MSLRIHHLNCGTMCPLCERLIAGTGSWRKPGRLVCHCLLVETAEGLVLIDTGLGRQDIAEPKRRLGSAFLNLIKPVLAPDETALSQIEALGFQASDVRHILPTHLDADHAGGLSDFPAARVHVLAAELEQIRHPTPRDLKRFRLPQFEHDPHWVVHTAPGESWFGFEAIRPIAGLDILLVPLIGHTMGHAGVAVRGPDKWLLHCGDAYYHRDQLNAAPRTAPALAFLEWWVQAQREPRLHNQARLRDLAAGHSGEIDIFCAHDPVEFERATQTEQRA